MGSGREGCWLRGATRGERMARQAAPTVAARSRCALVGPATGAEHVIFGPTAGDFTELRQPVGRKGRRTGPKTRISAFGLIFKYEEPPLLLLLPIFK
jgi:hypothetical protein